jgi:hypothetical protein
MVKKDHTGTPSHRRRRIIIISSIIGLLIIIRLILPYIVLHYVNKTLAHMKGYYGHVQDIDLSIYRGAYTINDIYLNKVDSVTHAQTPFFASKVIDLSVEWKALFHKRIVGELEFREPMVRFTKEKAEPKDMQKDTDDFRHLLKRLMPLKVNRFEIFDGKIQYCDSSVKPVVNLKMDNTHVLAQNLSNVKDTALLPAKIEASANVYKGTMNFNMRINAMAPTPTFDMNMELKNTSLPEFNDFFKAYAKIDIHKGNFGLYTEVAAKDRKYIGYVKPVIKDLEVQGPEDKNDNILNKLWESIVGTAGVLLRNHPKDQVATKVPIEGRFDGSEVDVWYAVIELLRNAFIQALYPSLDNDVTIGDVAKVDQDKKKTLVEKIFDKDKDKEKGKDTVKTRKQERQERREKKRKEREKEKEKEKKAE